MSEVTRELRDRIHAGIEDLKKARDEIRLHIHLGGMDAKDAWHKLEPRLEHVEHQARDMKDELVEQVHDAVEDLKRGYREVRASLNA